MAISDGRLASQDITRIKRVTWSGLVINAGLSLLKFIVGIAGRSQAVLADAVHSVSDMSTDVAVIIGVKFWSAPPDDNHPFGHRRIETIVTTGIALALGFVAVALGYEAMITLRDTHIAPPAWIAAVGPAVSIAAKEALYRWTATVGTRARSPAVVANAWHHRSDALSSVPALLVVIVSRIKPQWAFLDHIGAFIISLFILKVAWDIAKPALLELSGQGVSRADRLRIESAVMAVEYVRELHALRTRKYGSGIFVDLHLLVSGDMTVRDGHDVAENVKRKLLSDDPSISDVLVHIEPCD
ncbi:MAG: cation transporter [Lentisphaerales bacterium]|jgi:cation diffusion facilitator family transporter|nr:MAG: cation transporter [Lentisphaerales bacterium]